MVIDLTHDNDVSHGMGTSVEMQGWGVFLVDILYISTYQVCCIIVSLDSLLTLLYFFVVKTRSVCIENYLTS